MKLKVGDKVLVTKGKDKGRAGKIEIAFSKTGKVLVPGLNVYKKHKKAVEGQEGGIIEFSRPYPASSVSLICPHCAKKTRVSYRRTKSGEKNRICAKCKRQIDIKKLKTKN